MTIKKRTVWEYDGEFYDSEKEAERAQENENLRSALVEIRRVIGEQEKLPNEKELGLILISYGAWRLVNALTACLRRGEHIPMSEEDTTGEPRVIGEPA